MLFHSRTLTNATLECVSHLHTPSHSPRPPTHWCHHLPSFCSCFEIRSISEIYKFQQATSKWFKAISYQIRAYETGNRLVFFEHNIITLNPSAFIGTVFFFFEMILYVSIYYVIFYFVSFQVSFLVTPFLSLACFSLFIFSPLVSCTHLHVFQRKQE